MEFFFLTAGAIKKANAFLNISATGIEQDWELEFADPSRIEELLKILENGTVSGDYELEQAIAVLLLSSIDRAITNKICITYLSYRAIEFFSNQKDLRDKLIRFFFAHDLPVNPKEVAKILNYVYK